MATLFYLFTLLFIGYELLVLFKPHRFKDIGYAIKQYNRDKTITYDFITSMLIVFFQLFYIVWTVIGCFSGNAKYFLILLAIGMVTGPLKSMFKKADILIVTVDAFCSIFVLCLIFISHFA